LGGVFAKAGITVTSENRKQLNEIIQRVVGTANKDCPSTWRVVKKLLAEDEAGFVLCLRQAWQTGTQTRDNLKLSVYSDGGARGNPGPAAAAYLILDENAVVVKKQARFLGKRTNNQAEYEALVGALEAASQIATEEVVCHLDSELVCRHLTGEYKVKNPELLKLWKRVQELKRCFKRVSFVIVPRTNKFIQEADGLVNDALDGALD
jgi:ribonuclease HI